MSSSSSGTMSSSSSTISSSSSSSNVRLYILQPQVDPLINDIVDVGLQDDLLALAYTFLDKQKDKITSIVVDGVVVRDAGSDQSSISLAQVDSISDKHAQAVISQDDNTTSTQRSIYAIVSQKKLSVHSGRTIQLFIRSIVGRNYTVDIDSHARIEEVKEILYDKTGMPVEMQRLIYCGRPLDDDRTLADYNIQKESTLYLLPMRPSRRSDADDGS